MFTFWEMFTSLAPFFNFREMFTSVAPFITAAVVIVLSPFAREHIPSAVSDYLVSMYRMWLSRFSTPQVTVVIEEEGNLKISNQIYEAARAHLRTLLSNSTKPKRFKVNKQDGQNRSTIDVVKDEEVIDDNFRGITLKWKLCAEKYHDTKRYFELSFDKGFENEVLECYLPDILGRYEEIQNDNKVVKLLTCDKDRYNFRRNDKDGRWNSVALKHPITFEKLAMDPKQKKMLTDDLKTFLERKDLYENVGKTWKRGYLLYGPPGTGKSSLIAAMANYLKFDIYDLNLSGGHSDEDLRSILLSTTNRSILVIEDIDCGTVWDDEDRRPSFTLSGLLNIIDGLWSSCGEERIIVFTTYDKDKLDPALLRPGRMDVHVHMSYCTIDGFKLLATNYLKIEGDHQLYRQIEGLLKNVKVTPAEIAEELLKTPAEIAEAPAEIAEELLKTPAEIAEKTPAEIAEELLKTPAEISEAPAEIAEELLKTPAEIAEKTPAEIAEELLKTPAEISEAPAEIAEELLKTPAEIAEKTPAEIAEKLLKDAVLQRVVKFLEQKELEKAKAAKLKESLKERLKSAGIDVDAEGYAKFLKQKKIENAKAKEAERLLNSDDTDVDVEGLAEFIKKKIEDAKAAEKRKKSK